MGKKEIFAYVLEILTVQCTVTVHMTDTPYTNKAHTQHTQTNTLTHSDSLSIKLKSKYLFQVPIISKKLIFSIYNNSIQDLVAYILHYINEITTLEKHLYMVKFVTGTSDESLANEVCRV